MRSVFFRMVCRLLIAALTLAPFAGVNAAMIGVDQLAATSSTAQVDRLAVLEVLNRPEVVTQLQAQGIDQKAAIERVNAMTDSEVVALKGQIDSLPAGAKSNGWWWAAGVVVVLIIWYYWMR